MSYMTKLIVGFIGTTFLCIFVGGLSQSISSGFAGFVGGAPFMIIAIVVKNEQEAPLDHPSPV